MQDTFNLLLLFELVLPFFILTLVLSFILFRRKAQDKSALQRLITQYKENENGRRESIVEFLKNKVGLEDPAREEASNKLLKARKLFLQKIITTFLTRKAEAIENLDNELSIITSAYHKLSITLPQEKVSNQKEEDVPPSAEPEIKIENDSKLETELKQLREANKNLETEVETTLSTLNSIFAEYTSMFGEETDKKDMSVEDILSAMESYGQDNVDAASETDPMQEELAEAKPEEPEAKPEEPEAKPEEPEAKAEKPEAEEEPSWDEAFAESEEPEAKAEEPEAEEEPSWDEAFAESEEPEAKVEEPEAEEEPGWDEAFAESEEPEAKAEEPEAVEEPSWDEAFAESEEPEANEISHDQTTDKDDDNKTDDGWGDDAEDDSEDDLDDEDLEDMQPEWGNAVEEELLDPEDDKN